MLARTGLLRLQPLPGLEVEGIAAKRRHPGVQALLLALARNIPQAEALPEDELEPDAEAD